MKLSDRTILITGGSSGIGYSLAKQLIANGNKVIICGRNKSKLSQAKQQSPALETICCDINSSDDLNEMVSFIGGKYPELDTLINNAGIQHSIDLTIHETTDQLVVNEISTNLTAHINLTHRLYDLLCSNSQPAIWFVGSALALVPRYSSPIYSAAKAGLHSYIKSLRHQAVKDGIRIIEIFPDVVDTPMTQHRFNEIKMDPDEVATQVMARAARNNLDIFIGRTKLLSFINRMVPSLVLK